MLLEDGLRLVLEEPRLPGGTERRELFVLTGLLGRKFGRAGANMIGTQRLVNTIQLKAKTAQA